MSADPDKGAACPKGDKVLGLAEGDRSLSEHSDQKKKIRSVCFPNENQLVTEYFEPANPWHDVPTTSRAQLAQEYLHSCRQHNTAPIDSVLQQIRELPEQSIGGSTRAGRLCLADCSLKGAAPADALESVLRKVQFRRIELDHAEIDDEGAEALFDMIEYYESACVISITGPRQFGIRGWQAASRMIKKSAELSELELAESALEPSHAPVLARALRPHTCGDTRLRALCLQRANLSGEALMCLVIALKSNSSVRELRLPDNNLTPQDAQQLASLLRFNTNIQLLDLSNNQIQDTGVGHLADALVEQAAQTPPSAANSPISPQLQPLSALDTRGLAFLVLWNNQLTRNCAPHLSKALRSSQSLCVLNIGRNALGTDTVRGLQGGGGALLSLGLQCARLGPDAGAPLSDLLRADTKLQRLDLRDNRLGPAGLQALVAAMNENHTLTQLDLDDPAESTSLSTDSTAATVSRLTRELRALCRRNEPRVTEPERRAHRKISLTCHTACVLQSVSGRSRGARLRSPLPSPAPSPAGSPTPHQNVQVNRFSVTRVTPERESSTDSSSPGTPRPGYCPTPSRFKVMQVNEPPSIQVHPAQKRAVSRFSVTRNYDSIYNPSPRESPSASPTPSMSPTPSTTSPSVSPCPSDNSCTDSIKDSPKIEVYEDKSMNTQELETKYEKIYTDTTKSERSYVNTPRKEKGYTETATSEKDSMRNANKAQNSSIEQGISDSKCSVDSLEMSKFPSTSYKNASNDYSSYTTPSITTLSGALFSRSVTEITTVPKSCIKNTSKFERKTSPSIPITSSKSEPIFGPALFVESTVPPTAVPNSRFSISPSPVSFLSGIETFYTRPEIQRTDIESTKLDSSQRSQTKCEENVLNVASNTSDVKVTENKDKQTTEIKEICVKNEFEVISDAKKEFSQPSVEFTVSNTVEKNELPKEIETSTHVLPKDIVEHNVLPKDIVEHNVLPKDIVKHNVLQKDLVEPNVLSKDIVEHNVLPKDIVELNVLPKDIPDIEHVSKDIKIDMSTEVEKNDTNVSKAIDDVKSDIKVTDTRIVEFKSKHEDVIFFIADEPIHSENVSEKCESAIVGKTYSDVVKNDPCVTQDAAKTDANLVKNSEISDSANKESVNNPAKVHSDKDFVNIDDILIKDDKAMMKIEAITEDLGNIIKEMKMSAISKKKCVDIDTNIVPGNFRDVVLKKNKSESSLDSPDLEVSRFMNKKIGSPFRDSNSSLEISGSSMESLNALENPKPVVKQKCVESDRELDRRKEALSTENSVESTSEVTPNTQNFLNTSVSSNESVSPIIFGKSKKLHGSLSSLEASVSSLDSKQDKIMVTSADSGIEHSLQNPTENKEDASSNEGTLTHNSSLRETIRSENLQETLTSSPKRTSSLLDVPALKSKGLDRMRKISWVAPSPSFHIPQEKVKEEKPSHLEKLLSLFQHPTSLFSRQSDDERKSASNTPPRKDSTLTSSFWSWGSAIENYKEEKEDSSEATDSTLSERVQVSFVDESFSKKLDKTPSTDTDNTLSEFQFSQNVEEKVTDTTDVLVQKCLDLSLKAPSDDLNKPNDFKDGSDKTDRPRSFAAVLKASGSENQERVSPEQMVLHKLPGKLLRGIKENISPENTLTTRALTSERLDKGEESRELAPIATIEETCDISADNFSEEIQLAYIDDVKVDIQVRNAPDVDRAIDLGKDALSYLMYEREPKEASLAQELQDAAMKEMIDLSPELVIDEAAEVFPRPLTPDRAKIKRANSLEEISRSEEKSPKARSIAFQVPETQPRDIPSRRPQRTRTGSSPKSLPESLSKKKRVSSLGKMARDSLLALNMTAEEIAEFRRSHKLTSVESLRSLESVSEESLSRSRACRASRDSLGSLESRCRACFRSSQDSLGSLDSVPEDCKCNIDKGLS